MYKCMFSAVLVRKGVILRRLIALHDPLYVLLHCLTCMTDCSPDIICIMMIHCVYLFIMLLDTNCVIDCMYIIVVHHGVARCIVLYAHA